MNEPREEQSQEPTNAEPRGREVTARPDYAAAFPTYYANFAFITHTTHDLSIDFCLLAPPYHLDESRGILSVPVVTRVTIPSGLIQGLIDALQLQLTIQRQEQQEGHMGILGPLREGSADG